MMGVVVVIGTAVTDVLGTGGVLVCTDV